MNKIGMKQAVGEIQVGDYSIKEFDDGTFYIESSDGEGMETSEKKLEAAIAEFYEREF